MKYLYWNNFLTIHFLIKLFGYSEQQPGVMHEVCQWETFNASCASGELLIMESARYGRMSLGRCLTTDYFVGCSADVLNHVDTICSGRPHCSIEIPDPKLFNVQPCRKDLVAHFTASYSCKKVVTGDANSCTGVAFTDLPPKGILATHITESSGIGSKGCPWKIEVSPGQHINVSVYDFSSWGRGVTDSTDFNSNGCHIVGVVKEEQHHVEIRTCAGGPRHYSIYLSTTDAIEIEIFQQMSALYAGYAMIEYEAVGCPNMDDTEAYKTHRKGDIVMVNCIKTSQTWHLVCTGNGWIGQIGNCTLEDSMYSPADKQAYVGDDIPFGLLIAISIGAILGMILGLLFLMIVLLCKKKAKTSAIANPPERCAAYIGGEGEYSKHSDVSYKLIELRKSQASLCKHDLTKQEVVRNVNDNTMAISHVDGLWYKKDVLLPDQQNSLLCTNCTGNCHTHYNEKDTFHFDLIHDDNRRLQPLSTFIYPTVHQESESVIPSDPTLNR